LVHVRCRWAANGLNWLAQAEGLYRAFKILREVWEFDMASLPIRAARAFQGEETPESVGSSAMLLAAFTMENLLKGLVVVREPGSVQPRATDPERLLDWRGNGHDLLALARLPARSCLLKKRT
jgi:hypothetical protein